MSDTPETDASCGYALSSHYGRLEGSYLQMDRNGPFVHAEVARKLERERDEAREERNKLKSLNESYAACWDEIKDALNESEQGDKTCDLDRVLKAIRERDEAWDKYDALATEHMLEINKLCEERDEAREQVNRYRYNLDLLPIKWDI